VTATPRNCEDCGSPLEPVDVNSATAHRIIAAVGVAVVAVDSIGRCPRDGAGILVERLGDGTTEDHPFERSAR
jgi:hypothetical protein